MPTAHLIFFPDPRELTDAQIEEARLLGHLRDEEPPAKSPAKSTPAAAPDDKPKETGK